MKPDTMNDQFLVCGFVLMVVAFLTSAAAIDYRRNKKSFLSIDPRLGSNLNEFDRDDFPPASLNHPEDLYAYNRTRVQPYEARVRVPLSRAWE